MHKKIAVLPAAGLGDALLMMIASHHFRQRGCEVTTFHATFSELSTWFPGHLFAPKPLRNHLVDTLKEFDSIIVENDNSSTITLLRQAFPTQLSVFYPTYSLDKHGSLSSEDQVFNPTLPMASNIARATAILLGEPTLSTSNGITPPNTLIHRKERHRVLIHPSSRNPQKNWLPERFIELAHHLASQKYQPVFSVSPDERRDWMWVEEEGYELPLFSSLDQLAEYVYESGYVIGNDSVTGHLGSNLNIPTLIIANDRRRMQLWRPGWLQGKLVLPPRWIPNFKWMRWRENQWQRWITVNSVLKAFKNLS